MGLIAALKEGPGTQRLPRELRFGRLAMQWRSHAIAPSQVCGKLVGVSTGEELLEERRRRRQAGDPRLTDADREILGRLVDGDLADEFQGALDAVSDADPLLGGYDNLDDVD